MHFLPSKEAGGGGHELRVFGQGTDVKFIWILFGVKWTLGKPLMDS